MMLNYDFDQSSGSKEVIFDSSTNPSDLTIKDELRIYDKQFLSSSVQEGFLEIICLLVDQEDQLSAR